MQAFPTLLSLATNTSGANNMTYDLAFAHYPNAVMIKFTAASSCSDDL
jgi:hypothetical protein